MPNNKTHSKKTFLNKAELYRFDMPYGIKFDYQPIQPTIAPHSHAFIEFFYILDGKINHILNGVSSTLSAGDFALIDYGTVHNFSKIRRRDVFCYQYPVLSFIYRYNSVQFRQFYRDS